MRQLALGDNIDSERITATYQNGVLTVTLPVAERAKPRRIEVSAHSEAQTLGANKQAEISS
jgi:HSP20 family protein